MDLLSLLVIFGYLGASFIDGYLILPKRGFKIPKFVVEPDTIVGGHEAAIEDHPYQVGFSAESVGITFFCAGFIVSQDYILTAAHCTQGVNPSSVKLMAGSAWYNNGTIIPIAKVMPHPHHTKYDFDVGILKTATPIQFSKTIQPIKLPDKGKTLADDSMIIIAGWGTTSEGLNELSEHLMAVEVPVVNFDKCKNVYGSGLTTNMWCAGYLDAGGKDTCQGDSGGASVQNGVAVGIVSFGFGCARPGYPGVYTNIAAPDIRDFISKETGL